MFKGIWHSLLFSLAFYFNAAGQNMDSLKLALKTAKHDTARCKILYAMVEAENDDAVWPQFNEQLLKLVESKLKTTLKTAPEYRVYQKHYAEALNNVGYLAHIQGNIPKSLNYHVRSLKVWEEIGDKGGMASCLNNMGSIYDHQGDIPKALEYYDRSLKIREETGDKFGIASCLNNIGSIYEDQGDISKALEYWERSLKIKKEIGDKKGIALSLNNIGGIYYDQGDFNKALDYNAQSLKINEEIGDKRAMARNLDNMGVNYKHQGDFSKALEFSSRSLKIYEEIGNKNGIASALQTIGDVYFRQKNYAKALDCELRSMKMYKELGYPQMIRNAAKQLNKIYKATGNYKLALENYELFIQMRDSINNIETQKATIKQQSKYEYEKQKALEDEKHNAELKIQEEKARADEKRQNTIIGSVSIVLVLTLIFSFILYNRFKTTQKQKEIIEKKENETQVQKHIIEEKQKEILDSINYAKRIQYTLLAHDSFLKEHLSEHFIYYAPKDIVSGDFYWAAKKENSFYLAVCDSTGHGVPGAFMSLLNIGFLSEAINEKGIKKPNEVFDYVREKLTSTISKEGQRDGFDGVLLCFDQKSKSITYSAANISPILIQKNQVIELPANRMPVGIGESKEHFTLHTIEAQRGDILYLYTDGYADQFGGPKGKKFKYKQLNELLLTLFSQPLIDQKRVLETVIENWREQLEQVDDITIIGLRI